MMIRNALRAAALLAAPFLPMAVRAQAPATSPDVVVFSNGEQLTGELIKADNSGITFKSPMAGQITVTWANIKSVQSTKSFAVIPKGVKLTRKDAASLVPQGPVAEADKQIAVSPGANAAGPAGKTLPVSDVNLVLPAADFSNAVNSRPSLVHGWAGSATGAVSLVNSTQTATTFTGAVNLVRATPSVDWLPPHDRTILNYTQSYGTTSQPGTPTVETNIYHAAGERDQYFTPRLFAFGSVTFDHNFSSSLDLQQAYGGGIGATVLNNSVSQFDVRGDIHYERQNFFNSAANPTASSEDQNLAGSTFTETYLRHLSKKGLVLNEMGSYSAAWTQVSGEPRAWSAHVQGNLVFPVYKGIGFNVGAVDDYLNDAPVGTKQNSTQFTTGITYTIKPR